MPASLFHRPRCLEQEDRLEACQFPPIRPFPMLTVHEADYALTNLKLARSGDSALQEGKVGMVPLVRRVWGRVVDEQATGTQTSNLVRRVGMASLVDGCFHGSSPAS